MAQTRGERNNNPGNIRWDGKTMWEGLAEGPGSADERGFCVFTEPKYGLRALAKVLLNYQQHDNCSTIRQILTRWAPPTENDTLNYIGDVCHYGGWLADSIPRFLPGSMDLFDLVKAIVIHENGHCAYEDSLIGQAVAMALGVGG
jgi:hypothetical protein